MVSNRTAFITGSNRGIGFEVARQLARVSHRVILGARDYEEGLEAKRILTREGFAAELKRLDVTDAATVLAAAVEIEAEFGRLDVLVNCAGVALDEQANAESVDIDRVRATMEVNLYGAWRMTQAVIPIMRRQRWGRIVNVSSGSASFRYERIGRPAYRLSKCGLNLLTAMLAQELKNEGILVNAVCPGWVATRMGGPGGRPVDLGAAGIVWAATLPDDGPTGGFFRDGQLIPW